MGSFTVAGGGEVSPSSVRWMTEAELIAEVKSSLADPKRRTTMVQKSPLGSSSSEVLPYAPFGSGYRSRHLGSGARGWKKRGISAPVLLGKLWAEVANGGSGRATDWLASKVVTPSILRDWDSPGAVFSMLDSLLEPVL